MKEGWKKRNGTFNDGRREYLCLAHSWVGHVVQKKHRKLVLRFLNMENINQLDFISFQFYFPWFMYNHPWLSNMALCFFTTILCFLPHILSWGSLWSHILVSQIHVFEMGFLSPDRSSIDKISHNFLSQLIVAIEWPIKRLTYISMECIE